MCTYMAGWNCANCDGLLSMSNYLNAEILYSTYHVNNMYLFLFHMWIEKLPYIVVPLAIVCNSQINLLSLLSSI